MAPDRLLGHVKEDGKIIRSQVGLDEEIGHVDLRNGHIYEKRFGPALEGRDQNGPANQTDETAA